MSNKPGNYTDFVFQQPFDGYLKQIIDNYFYIHLPAADIEIRTEYTSFPFSGLHSVIFLMHLIQ